MVYHHAGGVAFAIDATGRRTETEYDDLGRMTRSISVGGDPGDADDLVTTYTYDDSGRLTHVRDPLDRVTKTDYDDRGLATRVTYPDGSTVEYAYDGVGNRTSMTDELERTTRYLYDARNRLVETIHPDGESTRTRYDGTGRVAATIDELGRETHYEYDAAGRLRKTTSAAGTPDALSAYDKYNALGELIETSDPNGNITQFFHDDLGRVVLTRVLDKDEPGAFDPDSENRVDPSMRPIYVETTDYDANGNVVETVVYDTLDNATRLSTATLLSVALRSQVDESPENNEYQITRYEYDPFDRLTRTLHADGTSVSVLYDTAGRVRRVSDEVGAATTTIYDDYGRQVEMIYPDPDGPDEQSSPRTQTQYDAAGNVVVSVNANGAATRFRYDSRNRLVSVTDAVDSTTKTLFDRASQVVATVDALGVAVGTRYDERGRPVQQSWVDPDPTDLTPAPTVSSEYDPVGNLLSSTDPRGFRTNYSYDAHYRLETETSERTGLVAGDVERLGTVVDGASPEDATTTYAYDANGNLLSVTDPREYVVNYEYDELDRRQVEKLADPDGSNGTLGRVEVVSVYDGYSNVERTIESSDQGDRTNRFYYDERNRLTREQRNVHLAGANLGARDFAVTYFGYDDAGRLTSEERLARGEDGVLITSDTQLTRYEYDLLGRMTAERLDAPGLNDAGRQSTTYKYDAVGNLVSETFTVREGVGAPGDAARSTTTLFEYDAVNRPIAVTEDAFGVRSISRTGYDANGNPVVRIDGSGVLEETRYDELYRVIETSMGDPNPYDTATRPLVETVRYDEAGNPIEVRNAEGDITRYEYNTFGQLLRETTPLAAGAIVSTYAYDKSGNQIGITDPNGNETTFVFDGWNRVTQEVQGDDAASDPKRVYRYNERGNLESTIDRNGRKIEYEYDDLDRLRFERWYDTDTASAASDELEWRYDQLGRLVRASHVDQTNGGAVLSFERFVYDTLDRLTVHQNYDTGASPTGPRVDLTYQYEQLVGLSADELNGVWFRMTHLPSIGESTTYADMLFATDGLGRTVRMVEGQRGRPKEELTSKSVHFTYDDAGRPIEIARRSDRTGEGVGVDFQLDTEHRYDAAGRLRSIDHVLAALSDSEPVAAYAYERDNASRITGVRAETRRSNLVLDRAEEFAYDAAGRLANWSYELNDLLTAPSAAPNLDVAETVVNYGLDAAGNRGDNGQLINPGSYNRVASDNDATYLYDDEGNLERRDLGADGYVTYQWDHRNRLVAVVDYDSSNNELGRVEHAYNQDDLRILKVIRASNGDILSAEHYVWDGGQLAAVIDRTPSTPSATSAVDGELTRRVQNGPGVDQPLFEEVFAGPHAADDLLWAATDHAGSVRDVFNPAGEIVNHLEYDSYGEPLRVVNGLEADVSEHAIDAAFAGREWDEDLGLYYNRARWYDASQGRFISEDPIGFAGGDANLYRYGGGDTVNFGDPSGLYQDPYGYGGSQFDDFGLAWGGYDFDDSFGLGNDVGLSSFDVFGPSFGQTASASSYGVYDSPADDYFGRQLPASMLAYELAFSAPSVQQLNAQISGLQADIQGLQMPVLSNRGFPAPRPGSIFGGGFIAHVAAGRAEAARLAEVAGLNQQLKELTATRPAVFAQAEREILNGLLGENLPSIDPFNSTGATGPTSIGGVFYANTLGNPYVAGTLQAGGGAVGSVFSGYLIVASGFTAVPAYLSGAYSLDQFQAGLRTVYTGEFVDTVGASAIGSGVEYVTGSEFAGNAAGLIYDVGGGLASGRFLSGVRYAPARFRQTGGGFFSGSADDAYDTIRRSTTDAYSIALNTGIKPANIQKVKDHVFYQKHLLDRYVDLGEPAVMKRFDSDLGQANAWKRLEQGTHTPADMQFLRHEAAESFLMRRWNDPSYHRAHNRAQQSFPMSVLDE